ncbi:24607_t:CDS:2 [Gigaspora margarita]|uniref:24607_t:CDS:1 n=1 Tax=Gigaspora margarita TaxID=4874 RepID=A0ABN7UII2_GIGMA|nr:24607_t:CDS:2 [Gigaspora margarita]
MSQNKDRSVTVENETSSSTNSDVEQAQKTGQANFETNFGHLFMDLLRFLCHELGISEAEVKQDLVNHLASEAKKRCRLDSLDNSEKEKKVEPDKDSKPALNYNSSKFNFEAFSDEFGGVPSDDIGLRSKTSGNFISPQMHAATNEMPPSCRLQEALLSGDVKYVYLARQVALERAYVVRVTDEDGWSVAAKMVASETIGPMSELFGSQGLAVAITDSESKHVYTYLCAAATILSTQLEFFGTYLSSQHTPQHVPLQNPRANTQKHQRAFQYSSSPAYKNFSSTSRVGPSKEITIQDPEEVNYTREGSMLKSKEKVLNKEQFVMERLHSAIMYQEMRGTYNNCGTGLGCSSVVAYNYRSLKGKDRPATTKRKNSTWHLRVFGTLQQQKIEVKSDSNRLVQEYLGHAEYLIENSISTPYRKRLEKAWRTFVEFAAESGFLS